MRTTKIWLFASLLSAFGACTSSPATQITVGVMSQIQVPKDLRSVRITASVNGNIKFCETYPVDDGMTSLPQSLALAPETGSTSVLVTVVGFEKTKTDVIGGVPDECSDRGSAEAPARILRRSRQQYAAARNLYVPMPLRYACYGVECAPGETCRGGRCTQPDADPSLLPDYVPDLLFGNASTCFDPDRCLADAIGPVVVDANACIYEVPAGTSLRELGMNVRAIYEGHAVEVLDLDKDEGFFLPDPARPQRFQLAPGLCKPAMGARRIVNLNASRTCVSKNVFQPMCAGSGKPLSPATSSLYLLMDRDTTMSEYIGVAAPPDQALEQVLRLVLGDPVFSSTTEVALRFVPDMANACGADYAAPEQPFKAVWEAADPIASTVKNTTPFAAQNAAGQVFSTAGMTLGARAAKNRRAVFYVTNRDITQANCGPALAAGVAGLAGAKIDTYVMSLRNSMEQPADTQTRRSNVAGITGAKIIAAEGPGKMESQVATLKGLSDLIGDLAACVYEAPNMLDAANTTLYFQPPFPQAAVTVPFNAQCTAGSMADGWNRDGDLLRVCGTSCSAIRSAIALAGQTTALRSAMGPVLGQQVLVFTKRK